MESISKEDLSSDVVKAVIERYRTADPKVRIASLQGAIFVLKWQAAEKLSGDALAKIAAESLPGLSEEIERSHVQAQCAEQPDVWAVLERLISAADAHGGGSEENKRTGVDAVIAEARALLARKRTAD